MSMSKRVRDNAMTLMEIKQRFSQIFGGRDTPGLRLKFSDFRNLDVQEMFLSVIRNDDLGAGRKDASDREKWDVFKEDFLSNQESIGFHWVSQVGQAGPIELESITLPAECGEELAEKLVAEGVHEGDFIEILREEFPNVTSILGGVSPIDISVARDAFKGKQFNGGRTFRLRRGGSPKFSLVANEFQAAASEADLGEIIKGKIAAVLNLRHLEHVQNTRRYGRFKNLDFEGFGIRKGVYEDDFLMYSFELKAKNSIFAVSEAISQAVNYRSQSNYTYIIIPKFTSDSFFDEDRHHDFLQMCRDNGLGVISVEFTDEGNPDDLVIIEEAPYSEVSSCEKLLEIVCDNNWEKCHLCRRIVHITKDRQNCGWMVSGREDEHCMKLLMEKNMIQMVDGVEGGEN